MRNPGDFWNDMITTGGEGQPLDKDGYLGITKKRFVSIMEDIQKDTYREAFKAGQIDGLEKAIMIVTRHCTRECKVCGCESRASKDLLTQEIDKLKKQETK